MTRHLRHGPSPQGRWVFAAIATFFASLVVYFTIGMPGMDHGPTETVAPNDMDHSAGEAMFESLEPQEFAERLEAKRAVVVNVHVPYEGELGGTDFFVPFDQIDTLSIDRDDELLLYCRSGDMSEQAATRLTAAGFSRVAHLAGGMAAWQASGRAVVVDPSRQADQQPDR